MVDQVDFIEAGEDFLEHFGKLGMKWDRRKANYDSDSDSDSNSSPYSSPYSNRPNQYDPEQSYVEVRSQRQGMSRNGKIATGVVLGAVGVGLVLAMSPGARNVGMNFVSSQKDNFKALTPKKASEGVSEVAAVAKKAGGLPVTSMPKVPNVPVKYAGFRDFPKPPVKYAGFNTLRPLAGNKNIFPRGGGLPLSSMPKAPMASGASFFKNAGGLPLSSIPKAPVSTFKSFSNVGGLPLTSMPKVPIANGAKFFAKNGGLPLSSMPKTPIVSYKLGYNPMTFSWNKR